MAEWLQLLTFNPLPCTAVGSSNASVLQEVGGSTQLVPEIEGHLRSSSTSKAGKLPYDLYCVGAK
jgi:hypothetical protein